MGGFAVKHLFVISVLILTITFSICAADIGDFSINAAPRGIVPLGEGADYFEFGYGGSVSADFSPAVLPLLFARLEFDYEFMPIVTTDGLSIISITAGPGVQYSPIENLNLAAWGTAGYFFGSITDGSGTPGGNLSLSAGAAISYGITPAVSIALSGDYTSKLHLFNGIGITLGTVIHPEGFTSTQPVMGNSIDLLESLTPGISGAGLDVSEVSFNQVFPVLFKHYDDNPVGTVELFNNENKDITEVSLSFYVDRYMDNPKQSPVIKTIEPGQSANFDIFGLFSDSVLDITEGTKVSANVILKYTYKKKETSRKYTVSMDMYDRNAITWDDDRKAAAFVTAKDPAILETAKNISGWVKEISPAAISKNLCIAMGIHNGLNAAGVNYQIDPKTPFTEFSADSLAVDFLQFPRQTLSYTSGDCDDLSILYSALMEAVGMETAFITIPGHIFMA
ncbi:MAG TPA: hypothetical protein DCO79_06390, partial [Spirochaeta sp.]|nr:hypothetical protein [Spirochaeta sp.]